MNAARIVLGALLALAALCPRAWGADEEAPAPQSLQDVVRMRQSQIQDKLTIARHRIRDKNFLAARSAIGDAAARVEALHSDLPPQKLYTRLGVIESKIKDGQWSEARTALESALRELDSQARYIDVTKIWQHLDEARAFVADRRGRLALQELRAAQRIAYLDDIATPLRRAILYMSDARRELLKLPTVFKSKRASATDRLDAAETELADAYAAIEKLLEGKYATGT